MFPLLAKLGPVPIHTYGVMIALGFLGAAYLNRKLAIRSGLSGEAMVDFTFWGLLVGFLGARILFVLTRLSYFASDPVGIFRIWEGGFVFWGGPLIVIPWGAWYLKRHRLPFWKTADISVCGLVVGHILGRIGCVSVGCCYGRPTGGDWGLRFHTETVEPALRGIALHPVQLYEAAALALLLVGLLRVFRKKAFDGQVFLTYLLVYPVIRSVVETFRGDLIRGFVVEGLVSTSQFISALTFAGALVLLYVRLKELARKKSEA